MSLLAVFKYMAKQAVDCRNMVRVKVWQTHTTVWLLRNYSQRILTYYTRILLLDLTYGRTMRHATYSSSTFDQKSLSHIQAFTHVQIWFASDSADHYARL